SKRDRARESSDAKDERERQGDRAIGADAAVTHDLKLARAISAAAEAVRDVRKPVLVQGAGRRDESGGRENRAKQRRQRQHPPRPQSARPDETDDRARDGRRPGEAVEVERLAFGRRQGQPGEEAQRVGDARSSQSAHKNMATAMTPIAANPDSTKPHWRTRAFAAATSCPRSDR